MIQAVCWDVGGVFTSRPVDAVARVAAEHDLDSDDLFAAIFGPYHQDGDHSWHRLERGEISLKEAWGAGELALAEFGASVTLADFFRGFSDDRVDRSVVTDTVRELSDDGVAMAIITNNVKEFSEREGGGWHAMVPMDRMGVVIDSSAVGMRKPNPAIYLHTLEELGVDPRNAAFLDDMPANVQAARDVGMHGIVVGADPEPAMTELRSLVTRLR